MARMRFLKRFLPSVAVFVTLVAILATLSAAMMPGWDVEPLTHHIEVASDYSAIQARDTAAAGNTGIQAGKNGNGTNAKGVLKTAQEGTYQVKAENLRIRLTANVTINAILRSPLGAPGKRPATLFIHGAGTGKASEVYGDIASALSSAGIVTLVPDKRLDTYTTFHRNYYAMAEDYMTSLHTLQAQPDVDPAHTGIYAESEGTWIAEAMAYRHPGAIPFMMLTSPPVVSGRRQMTMAANTYVDYIGAPKGLNRDIDKFVGLDFSPLGLQYADFPGQQYLKDLTMPLLVSFGTDDLSMPIEQGATDIIDGAGSSGNDNVLVRYYRANHQMRVGAHTSAPGLPLDSHYTHNLENWTNAIADGTKADDWVTPQIAGSQPHQRFGVPTAVRPGLVRSLSTILTLLVSIALCTAMAGIVGICIAIGHLRQRSKQKNQDSSSSIDKNVDGQSSAKTTRVRLSWGDAAQNRFPHHLTTALTLNGCCAVLGIAAFFIYVIIAAKSALTLTPRGTLLNWGWVLLQVIALINVALLTWLIMELWRSRGSRSSEGKQSQGFWTPAHFIVAVLCIIAAVISLTMMAFFGLFSL
ncbi:alpha/beta hydrolase [Bifidobacterium sp. ESL0798]|uniref:alpha/beta hydrolase n=1 Tax=Bifidobacterium sp. ESL0798 TaxID=2983235 RepID=UPI0023F66EAA|nr:alpha/beta hydrolase [Bifidobacterium sp. ESL0798]WEV74449.1 alpha/beta hydrolase [Bifidobacterium sp. ESL0798]